VEDTVAELMPGYESITTRVFGSAYVCASQRVALLQLLGEM